MSKLPNAPLKEVVFDILWEMKRDEGGFPFDPGFSLAQGIFAREIRKILPILKRIIPENAPITVYPQPVYQFWQKELSWPLIQFGPGILTVNETEISYDWEYGYGRLIDEALLVLTQSYEDPLTLTQMQLRYVDAVELTDDQALHLDRFVAENLQIDLSNQFEMPGVLTSLQIQQGFQLADSSLLSISVNDGKNTVTGRSAVIWTTTVVRRGVYTVEEAKRWKNTAHQLASDVFKRMISESFYKTFL